MSSSSYDSFGAADDILTDAIEREEVEAVDRRTGRQRMFDRLLSSRDLAILIVAIALFVFFTALNGRFASGPILRDIALRMTAIGVVAVGMTFLFISGEIDLSVGANFGFLMVLLAVLIEKRDVNPWLAAGGMILLGMLIGAINGLMVTRVGVPSFITTLGMWVALRGMGNVLSGGIATAATKTDLDFYQVFGSSIPGTRVPIIFVVMLITAIIAAIVLARTRFGSDVYATGGDVEAARSNGINTKQVKLICFILTGAMCALAAALQFGRIANVPFFAGNGFELQVIAAIIIGGIGLYGGRGTIFGAMIGVVIYSMLASGLILSLRIKDFWDGVATGIIILFAAGLDLIVRRNAARVLGRQEK
jgi:ribose transport system permease protein